MPKIAKYESFYIVKAINVIFWKLLLGIFCSIDLGYNKNYLWAFYSYCSSMHHELNNGVLVSTRCIRGYNDNVMHMQKKCVARNVIQPSLAWYIWPYCDIDSLLLKYWKYYKPSFHLWPFFHKRKHTTCLL